jgi:predicted metal-dependent peptidase
MLQEAKKVITRSVEKAYKDYSTLPDSVKDLLKSIDAHIKKLNYKALLRHAIKKTLTTQDRTTTWHRPNKRYGSYAPGTTYDKAPYINVYIDTSGSISHTELNEFLAVMDGFLRNSAKKCNLGLWHTELYSMKKWKLNNSFDKNNVQSGGTDPLCVFKHMEETKPNLSIILTDGCFGKTRIDLTQKVIFVISKGGEVNHPYHDYGKTVKMEGLI